MHIYAGSDHFANQAILLHRSLGFRPYAIIPKESILTDTSARRIYIPQAVCIGIA